MPPPQGLEVPPGGFHGKNVVRELTGQRTPASRTYVTQQGTLLTLYFPAPIEYRDATGWHLVDDTLSPSAGGGWHNAADAATVSLPANLAAGPVAIQSPTSTVSFSVDGASPAVGRLSANTVTYPQALPGVDVSYRSKAGSLKETLSLAGPSSQRRFAFTATATAGVSLQPSGKGGLAVVDVEGRVIDVLAAPTMVDASGATSGGIVLAASLQAGAWHLSLTPDPAWLDAPGRAWPVAVDPSVTFSGSPEIDTYLSSASPTTSFSSATTFVIGHVASSGENDRALLAFPDLAGSRLPDITVLDAQLTMTQTGHTSANSTTISLYPAQKPWTSSATWNTYDGTNAWSSAGGASGTDYTATASDSQTGGPTDGDWNFHPRATLQSWFNFTTTTTATEGFFVNANQSVDQKLTFVSWDDTVNTTSWPYLYVEYTAAVGIAGS